LKRCIDKFRLFEGSLEQEPSNETRIGRGGGGRGGGRYGVRGRALKRRARRRGGREASGPNIYFRNACTGKKKREETEKGERESY
jgi:hypothetical protein